MARRHHRFISNSIQLRAHVVGRTRVLVSTLATTADRHHPPIDCTFKLLVDSTGITQMVTSYGKTEGSVADIAKGGER